MVFTNRTADRWVPDAANCGDRDISTVERFVAANAVHGRRLRILLLADDEHTADVVRDHIGAIKSQSHHRVTVVNPIRNRRAWRLATEHFDVVIVHYSICILVDHLLPPQVAAWLKAFRGPKIQIIQDEYRWIDRMTRQMADLKINAVFSSLTPDNIKRVYHHDYLAGIRFVSSLPGYVPRRLHQINSPALPERPNHLVYRGRPLPIWLGRFAQEKTNIGFHALALAERFDLSVDCKVAEEDRVYGRSWNELLMSGRATLATEGGATVFDFDGSVEAGVIAYRRAHPEAGIEEAWKAIVAPHEGKVVHKTITPRVLEAVMCRTALVMYPGALRGVLKPWEHYIPLARDGSNDEEVAEYLRDDSQLENLIERAYRRVGDDPLLHFDAYVGAMDQLASELAGMPTSAATSSVAMPRALVAARPAISFVEQRVSAFENFDTFSFRIRIILLRLKGKGIKLQQRVKQLAQHAVEVRALVFATFTSHQLEPPRFIYRQQLWHRADGAAGHRVLLLCDFHFRYIGTIRDHLAAFKAYSAHEICLVDARSAASVDVRFDVFDAVVVHYSMIVSAAYMPESVAQRIRDYNGYKILFIQDEYRWVNATVAAIADLGIDLIYSVLNKEAADAIYHHATIRGVRRLHTLTGFVPEDLTIRSVPTYSARPVDVGYRGRKLPSWLGQFAQEKWLIGERFKQDAALYRLVCDIEHEEQNRLYGDQWIAFLSNCKAVLGTESGASFVDFTGTVQPAVEAFEAANPNASFEEIAQRFLNERNGHINIRVISPRCFEAAALRTLMILYPGHYSGALEPWRHYVPLRRDHSNMNEVVAVLCDEVKAKRIIDNAYREVALNPHYGFRAMVENFDRDLAEHAPRHALVTRAEIKRIERRVEFTYRLRRRAALKLRVSLTGTFDWCVRTFVPKRYQAVTVEAIRSLVRRIRSSKAR
jgi:hypothetical protein